MTTRKENETEIKQGKEINNRRKRSTRDKTSKGTTNNERERERRDSENVG